MKFNEQEVLKKVFWPKDKENFLGNLFFNSTDNDFTNTKTIGAARTEKGMEVFYTISPMLEPENRTYFVKLIFDRENDEVSLNMQKSSPEIKNEKDVKDVLDNIQNSIVMMSSKPEFFPTGVLKNKPKPTI